MSCPQRVPLSSMILSGPIWRRHRHFLVPDRSPDSPGPFYVLDATTGRHYGWDIWPPRSRTIGVPTTWAYLHRGWTTHAYYLVPMPERQGRLGGTSERRMLGIVGRALTWIRCRVA